MANNVRCSGCGSLLKDDGKSAADRIIEAFGGAKRLADLTGIDLSSIYRWQYPKDRGGTDGAIPHGNHFKIMQAVKKHKITLTRSDFV